jgi:hypothetical protein
VRVQLSKRAARQVARESSWWVKHRPDAPMLFEDELLELLNRLSSAATLGVAYPTASRSHVRRILLPRSEYHVYFSREPQRRVVMIHAVWGACRERPPKL